MGQKQNPKSVARLWKQARKRVGDVALHYPHVANQVARYAAELRRQSEAAFQPSKESSS